MVTQRLAPKLVPARLHGRRLLLLSRLRAPRGPMADCGGAVVRARTLHLRVRGAAASRSDGLPGLLPPAERPFLVPREADAAGVGDSALGPLPIRRFGPDP